jgi:hypothetical protein
MEFQSWEESGRHNPGRTKYKRKEKEEGRYVRSHTLARGTNRRTQHCTSTLFSVVYAGSIPYYWNVLQDSIVPPVMPR